MLRYKKGFYFKSVIYNQPVDNNFTLSFGKTHYVLANLLLALVRGTEAKSKAQLVNKKIFTNSIGSNFSRRPLWRSLNPWQGYRHTQSPAALWAFWMTKTTQFTRKVNIDQEQDDQSQKYDLEAFKFHGREIKNKRQYSRN